MKSTLSTIAVAIAAASFCAGAMAQEHTATAKTSEPVKVAGTEKGMQTGTQPSNATLDDNAQRAHSRSTSATSGNKKMQHTKMAAGEVRDWRAIDKNHDNLISPEEMEAALKKGSTQGKSTAKP